MMFSIGSRSSEHDWTMGEHVFEEVDQFQYLGVMSESIQRNVEFTRHHKMVARKANPRTTEVWSHEDGNVQVPGDAGYSECEQYERIQRWYAKWTLGFQKERVTR